MLVHDAVVEYEEARAHEHRIGVIREVTMVRISEDGAMLRAGLRNIDVAELSPADFRKLVSYASTRWGAVRLRALVVFLKAWLEWMSQEGLTIGRLSTGSLKTPAVKPKPKTTYSNVEFSHLWDKATPYVRSLMGLGLFAGTNCADVAALHEDSFDGQWFVAAREKTGRARRAALPSWLVAEVGRAGVPLSTTHGPVTRRRVSTYWRDFTRRYLGEPRPYTAWRTTVRTVIGHIDPEALELCLLGHTPASTAALTGRNRVGLEHYVDVEAISDDRLRRLRQGLVDWVRTGTAG